MQCAVKIGSILLRIFTKNEFCKFILYHAKEDSIQIANYTSYFKISTKHSNDIEQTSETLYFLRTCSSVIKGGWDDAEKIRW
jgi:hypothetical protein